MCRNICGKTNRGHLLVFGTRNEEIQSAAEEKQGLLWVCSVPVYQAGTRRLDWKFLCAPYTLQTRQRRNSFKNSLCVCAFPFHTLGTIGRLWTVAIHTYLWHWQTEALYVLRTSLLWIALSQVCSSWPSTLKLAPQFYDNMCTNGMHDPYAGVKKF